MLQGPQLPQPSTMPKSMDSGTDTKVSKAMFLDYLQEAEALPPVVILDPPAFAKSRSARHKAVQGYKRLNALALTKMPADGLLWTFSCSQVVDAQLFEDTLIAAAVASGAQRQDFEAIGAACRPPHQSGTP